MIEIVFLDVGETLLRPHPSFAELFARVCRTRGYKVEALQVSDVQERLAPHLVDLADETGIEKPSLSPESSQTFWTHLYRRFLEELGIENEALARALYRTFSSTSTYKLFDDALPALQELHVAGRRLGLISNFDQWLEEMLVELDVGDLFDVTVISGVEGVEKPDVRMYEVALERAGVEPEAAVHVGDSIVFDIEPALKLGMRAVLLDRLGRHATLGLAPDVTRISSLEELPTLVANL